MNTPPKNFSPVEAVFVVLTATALTIFFFSWEIVKGFKLYERVVNDASFYPILYPLHFQLRRTFIEGFFPLWWSNAGLGIPILGVWWTASLYPLTLIFLPLDFWGISSIFFLLRIWLMLISAYYLARKIFSRSPAASWLAALTFAFSGYTIERLQMWEAGAFWLLPLFAFCVCMFAEALSWRWIIAGGLVGAMAVYSGHPPQAFYVFFFGLALWSFRLIVTAFDKNSSSFSQTHALARIFNNKILPNFFGVSAVIVLSILLSSTQLLPALEILKTYWHHHPVSDVTYGYPVRGIFSMILPWLAGSQKSNPLTSLLMRYMGLLPVTLALFGIFKIKHLSKNFGFLAGMTFLMLGVCYNLPIFRLWGLLPGFNRLANFVSMLPVLALCIGLLAGEALDYVSKSTKKSREFLRFLFWWAVFLLLVVVYGFWLVKFLTGIDKIAGLIADYETLKKDWLIQTFSAGVFLMLSALIFGVFAKKNGRSSWAAWLTVFLAFVGLLCDRFGYNYQGYGLFDKMKQNEAVKKLEQLIQSESSPVRVTSDFIPLYGTWLAGASDVRVISTALPYRYIYLMAKVNDLDWRTNPAHFEKYKEYLKLLSFPFPLEKLRTPLAELLGVKYAIVKPAENIGDMEIVYSSPDAMIVKNSEAAPVCFLARGVKVFKSAEEVLDFMVESSGKLNEALFAAEDYPQSASWKNMATGSQHAGEANCEILQYNSQRAVFETTTDNETFAIIADRYQPGWKAVVNGQEEKVLIVDYLLKGIKVPPGKSRLEIRYEPASFKVGLWVTAVSLLFLCVVLAVGAGKK